jgi:hypothetical protein
MRRSNDKPPPGFLSQNKYAAYRGCTLTYIRNLVKSGKLSPPALTPDGYIDVAKADQILGKPDPNKSRLAMPPADYGASSSSGSEDPDAPVYAVERARRERAQAALAELTLQERQGRLVSVDVVRAAAFTIFHRAMSRISDGFSDLAVELVKESDPAKAADRLANHLRTNMSGLCEEFLADADRRSS